MAIVASRPTSRSGSGQTACKATKSWPHASHGANTHDHYSVLDFCDAWDAAHAFFDIDNWADGGAREHYFAACDGDGDRRGRAVPESGTHTRLYELVGQQRARLVGLPKFWS